MSHVQISRYLTAAEYTLREVLARSEKKPEAILDRAASKGYGLKSLIQLIIESEMFRNK